MIASERGSRLVCWLAALCLGCSGTPGEDAGSDAGRDAGHDAGTDAPRDAGTDAPTLDGGWRAIATPAARCQLEVATDALLAATSWAIEPCDDRIGCRRIVSPGGPVDSFPFGLEPGHGAHDGSRGLFIVIRNVDAGARNEAWIVDDMGHAVMGFRTARPTGNSCGQGFFDVSSSEFGFTLSNLAPGMTEDYLYRAPLGADPVEIVDLRAPFASGSAQAIRVDGPRTAAWMSFQHVQAVESSGALSDITESTPGACEIADVVGDAIFVDCSSPTNVFVQLPGGATTPLFSTGVNFGLDSDGTDMVWLRYPGGHIEVWQSPFTTDPSAMVERHVADVPTSAFVEAADLRVGFGYAVLEETSYVLGVYRLSDGARAEIDAPTGEYWSALVQYVGPEEIAAATRIEGTRNGDHTLMFIRLDGLTFVPP